MAKIQRKTAQLFGVSAGATGVEEFASKQTTGTLVYSIDPADLQTAAWLLGWVSSIYEGTFAPYYQDRNAVDLVIFYQLAYLLQQGIPEWDSATTYFTDSVVQSGGTVYLSLVESNLNNVPPPGSSNSYWKFCPFPSTSQPSPTRTVLTYGTGTYSTPDGCKRIFVRLVGGGGGAGCTGGIFGPRSGVDGGDTIFGGITGGGGKGGTGAGVGGAGGSSTGGDVNISGGAGADASTYGLGGGSKFSSGPPVSSTLPNPFSSTYGCGGCAMSSSTGYSAGSGGAGAYAEKNIISPSASYPYTVGLSGEGNYVQFVGLAELAGQAGGPGIIIIDEFY